MAYGYCIEQDISKVTKEPFWNLCPQFCHLNELPFQEKPHFQGMH